MSCMSWNNPIMEESSLETIERVIEAAEGKEHFEERAGKDI